MSRARRIDTHQHLVPPGYAKWLREKGIRSGGIDLPAWSPSAALKFMDGHGIRTGILSLSTPGVYFGDVAEARRWARDVNEYTASVVADRPDRFGFFATVTLPDVEGALAEAEYALDVLNADGIVLPANNDGRYLGDPGFAPLLQFLHDRQVVVFVHPGELPGPEVPGIPTFTADFLLDTTRTVISSLCCADFITTSRCRRHQRPCRACWRWPTRTTSPTAATSRSPRPRRWASRTRPTRSTRSAQYVAAPSS